MLYRFNHCVRPYNMKNAIKILNTQDEDAQIVLKIIRRLHAGIPLRKTGTFVSKLYAVFVGTNEEYLLDGKNLKVAKPMTKDSHLRFYRLCMRDIVVTVSNKCL